MCSYSQKRQYGLDFESGMRIQVNWSQYVEAMTPNCDFGWDTHIFNFDLLPDRHVPIFDRVFAALLDDLHEAWLLFDHLDDARLLRDDDLVRERARGEADGRAEGEGAREKEAAGDMREEALVHDESWEVVAGWRPTVG